MEFLQSFKDLTPTSHPSFTETLSFAQMIQYLTVNPNLIFVSTDTLFGCNIFVKDKLLCRTYFDVEDSNDYYNYLTDYYTDLPILYLSATYKLVALTHYKKKV